MIKNILLASLFFSLFSFHLRAQVDYNEEDSTSTAQKKTNFRDRLFVTGDLTLNFGTFTVVGGNPALGYRVTDNFSAGIGATYFYYKVQGFQPESFYGGNLFLRQILFDVAFLQAEYHLMNVEAYRSGPDYNLGDRITIPLLYLGGGYRQNLGGNVYGSVKILWDVIEHEESRFQNPYFSVGMSIGL